MELKLRDIMEIQRAHDILRSIILREVPTDLYDQETDPLVRENLKASLDALCWVLGHDRNKKFSENLSRIEKAIEGTGYVLRGTN